MALATLTHGGKVLQLRTNPNSIRWTYNLNTNVEETYGGRVVQILSCNIDDLVVSAEAGRGGWPYFYQVATFFRDMLFDQRNGGEPGVFSYPNRKWSMKVYAVNFPFKDDWQAIGREFTMQFKVQEDISGVISSDTVRSELAKLKVGVGYKHNEYNTPPGDPGTAAWPTFASAGAAGGDPAADPSGTGTSNAGAGGTSNTGGAAGRTGGAPTKGTGTTTGGIR